MPGIDGLLKQINESSGLAWNGATSDLAQASNLSAGDRAVDVTRLKDGDVQAVLTIAKAS
jgi:hypothetical protein